MVLAFVKCNEPSKNENILHNIDMCIHKGYWLIGEIGLRELNRALSS